MRYEFGHSRWMLRPSAAVLALFTLAGCGGGGGSSPSVAGPPITAFTENPKTIGTGGTAALKGIFSGGKGVITPGSIPVTSGQLIKVTPASTTTYTLTVTSPAGAVSTAQATITVSADGEVVLNVPFVANNAVDDACVSASFAMVLQYYSVATDLAQVFSVFGAPPLSATVWQNFQAWVDGSPATVYTFLAPPSNGLGLQLLTYNNGTIADVVSCIDAGVPVVVLQQFSLTDTSGHDRVVIGYDPTTQTIIMNDPDPSHGPFFSMSYADFNRVWTDLGTGGGYGSILLEYLVLPQGSTSPLSRQAYAWAGDS